MTHEFARGAFRFGVGIEDTFIPQLGLGRRALDEYELTQHYDRWAHDLDLVKESGASTIRYGFPWYRLNPEPGEFVWSWADRVVDRLCELELDVIVDLVHYGTPLWLDNGFLNRNYAQAVADYAFALSERYGDRLPAWTPLNEPQWTARLCGESATWPPGLRGHDGYLQVMKAICTGIVESQQAIADATSGRAAFVHVEASFRYDHADVESAEAALLSERRFLSGDLLTGAVDDTHPLFSYLTRHGFTDEELAWFQEHTAAPDVVGINYYPMWSTIEYVRDATGIAGRERDDGATGLEELVRETSARYGAPLMITETSFEGTEEERIAWLREAVAVLRRLRSEIDIVGLVWWPFLDQIKWQYREGLDPVESYLHQLGLVSLAPDEVGQLERRANRVFDAYRELASSEIVQVEELQAQRLDECSIRGAGAGREPSAQSFTDQPYRMVCAEPGRG